MFEDYTCPVHSLQIPYNKLQLSLNKAWTYGTRQGYTLLYGYILHVFVWVYFQYGSIMAYNLIGIPRGSWSPSGL